MNAIDSRPIEQSYLPLDNYKDFKNFMEIQNKTKTKKNSDENKSAAELAA
jgi:hypothetical protein